MYDETLEQTEYIVKIKFPNKYDLTSYLKDIRKDGGDYKITEERR